MSTPAIARVECFVLRAPIAKPVPSKFGPLNDRPAVFVRVHASDGAYGWGEVFCNYPQVGAEHRGRLVESFFAPLLQASISSDPLVVRASLEREARQIAIQCGEPGPFAQIIGAIDQALWDLSARRASKPLWRHLGGDDAKVRVYASGIGPESVVVMALRKRDEGFRAFKLKIGFGAERDARNLASLREALGDQATIMTDANQSWQPDEARARVDELARYRPHWVEEPIAADHPVDVWRKLRSSVAVPFAAGENLRGMDAFEAVIDANVLAFVQPDVGKWGGITGCRDVASLAAARGVTYCPHWLGGGVGLAASMHLVAAAGSPESYAEVDSNPNPLREDVFPMRPQEGIVTLSDAPGLGVEPDLERLAPWIVRLR